MMNASDTKASTMNAARHPLLSLIGYLFLLTSLAIFVGCGGGGDSPTDPNGSNTRDEIEIVKMTPASQTTGLDNVITVSIEFDRPMAEVFAILWPGGWGLGSDGIDWLERSADGKTWSRTVSIESDLVYQLIVLGARGDDGMEMGDPEIASFTAMENFPGGGIRGNIMTAGTVSARGTILFIIDANRNVSSNGLFDDGVLISMGWVTDEDGDYVIPNLKPGLYHILAMKDGDDDGNVWGTRGVDLIGHYGDQTIFLEFDEVRVIAGQFTDGVDFSMLRNSLIPEPDE
ncbi:MAG: carboxypeptidase regulatory-like domain-containing protein [Gemmatimonadetes bacterium]|nr:carboxypeptidase regulatory-like domain-containing protein [Gemmatimonadota bacterium]